jgi:hypothetical protein
MIRSLTAGPLASLKHAGSVRLRRLSPAPTSAASAAAPIPIRRRRSAPLPDRPVTPKPVAAARGVPAPAPRRPLRLWTTTNQLVVAVLLWAGLAGILYAADPELAAARGAFFALLFGAIFFTLAPLIRGISLQFSHSRLYQEAVGMHAARQAFMLSTFITLNAFLQMQRSWSGLTALLLFSVFSIIEIVALARR